MRLTELIRLIDKEAALREQINAELAKWGEPANRLQPASPLRVALRAFGHGSLRKNAQALGVSPTFLSQCETGHFRPTRKLMLRVHAIFGLGAKDNNAGNPAERPNNDQD